MNYDTVPFLLSNKSFIIALFSQLATTRNTTYLDESRHRQFVNIEIMVEIAINRVLKPTIMAQLKAECILHA